MSVDIPKTQLALVLNEAMQDEVMEIPVYEPGDKQILVKAVAWGAQYRKLPPTPDYIGSILGYDAAGYVVKVGKNVTKFKVGDQVATMNLGTFIARPFPGAHSEYIVTNDHVAYKFNYELKSVADDYIGIGPIETFEAASNMGNAFLTIGAAFYHGFKFRKNQDHSKDTLLIFSAGGSIGMIGVQVAKYLGFGKVVVTSSPKKFDLMKKIGADAWFDYNDPDLVDKIRKEYGDSICYALDCYAHVDSYSKVYDCLSRTDPCYLASLLMVNPDDMVNIVKKTNPIQFIFTSSFMSYGQAFKFYGKDFVPSEGLVEDVTEFQEETQELLDNKTCYFIDQNKVPNGLYGLINPQDNKDSNIRMFARAAELPRSPPK